MTAVDERVESIEHLDFAPPCEYQEPVPEHGAEVMARCRHCSHAVLLCETHCATWREQIIRWVDRGAAVTCLHCLRDSRSFDEACEVVPL